MLIYLAHPVSGNVPANLMRARRWLAWFYREFPEDAALMHWILDCEVMNDDDPVERARGILNDQIIIPRCDALWLLGGRTSPGMAAEMRLADEAGIAILDLTSQGAEPSASAARVAQAWLERRS